MEQIFALLQPSEIGQRVEVRQFGIVTRGDLAEPISVVVGDRQHVPAYCILGIGDQRIRHGQLARLQQPGNGEAKHAQIIAQIAAGMLRQTRQLSLGEKVAPLGKAFLDHLAHLGESLGVRHGLFAGRRAALVDVHARQSVDAATGIDGPECTRQRGKIGRDRVDDVQRRKAQFVSV